MNFTPTHKIIGSIFGGWIYLLGTAHAQSNPTAALPKGPIRLIVPQAAGGTTYTIARALAEQFSRNTGVATVVDNKPGAGGNVGTEVAAKAAPDGNTLVVATSGTQTINPHIYATLPADPIKDFEPIINAGYTTNVTAVHPALSVRTLDELVAYARANPNLLNYGSAGVGSSPHLAGALFNAYAGVNITHVPYKGSTPSVTALVSGAVQLLHSGLVGLAQHAKAGKVRILSVNGNHRSEVIPETPTAQEAGVAKFDVSFWIGILTPSGASKAMIDALNRAFNDAIANPEFRKKLAAQGVEVAGGSPAELSTLIRTDLQKWRDIVRAAKIKGE